MWALEERGMMEESAPTHDNARVGEWNGAPC